MSWNDWLVALVNFVVGAAVGMVGLKLWESRKGTLTLARTLAAAIFAVVLMGTVLGVWNAYELREQAECQAQVNTAFLEALKVNTELSAQDRHNLDSTVERLVERGPGDASASILSDYLAERERIEEQREDYPPLPEEVCE